MKGAKLAQDNYNDALMNLAQAEEYGGLDLEILEQRAACYASLKDYHQTFFILNNDRRSS